LEVVLQPGQSRRDGERLASDLMQKLEISAEDLIDRAYLDLLAALGEHQK
jgi:adenylate cyclase class IV